MRKSCGECRKLRTEECRRPDYCVRRGYCDFGGYGKPRIDKECSNCGAVLKVQKTRPIENSHSILTWKYCPVCGHLVETSFDARVLQPIKRLRVEYEKRCAY